MPESLASLERYLANGTIKGVGPATAKKIVDTFGEETLHVLKIEPDKLMRDKRNYIRKSTCNFRSFFRKLGIMANSGIFRKVWNRCTKC